MGTKCCGCFTKTQADNQPESNITDKQAESSDSNVAINIESDKEKELQIGPNKNEDIHNNNKQPIVHENDANVKQEQKQQTQKLQVESEVSNVENCANATQNTQNEQKQKANQAHVVIDVDGNTLNQNYKNEEHEQNAAAESEVNETNLSETTSNTTSDKQHINYNTQNQQQQQQNEETQQNIATHENAKDDNNKINAANIAIKSTKHEDKQNHVEIQSEIALVNAENEKKENTNNYKANEKCITKNGKAAASDIITHAITEQGHDEIVNATHDEIVNATQININKTDYGAGGNINQVNTQQNNQTPVDPKQNNTQDNDEIIWEQKHDIQSQKDIEWKRQTQLIAKQITKQFNPQISEAFLEYVPAEFGSLEEVKDDLEDINDIQDSTIIDAIKQKINDIDDEQLFIALQEIIGKINYNQLKIDILPSGICRIISDYLNVIHLFLNENIVMILHYNNGQDSFGNFWEQSISFNRKTDEILNDIDNTCDEELRIGVVSHYNLNRMSVENEWTEQQKPFICEISNELIPKSLGAFLNCNVHMKTQDKIQQIRKTKTNEYIKCIKIVCKERKAEANDDNEVHMIMETSAAFRKEFIIPWDKMYDIFGVSESDGNNEIETQFVIHESYKESNPHLYENARLTVINGSNDDPLGIYDQ